MARSPSRLPGDEVALLRPSDTRNLARLRYAFRKLLHESDTAARDAGLTPQQHQLLLGIAGHTGQGWASVGELAEFLQVRHHTAVGLVDRAAAAGLVERRPSPLAPREVAVHLTDAGREAMQTLAAQHRKELASLRRMLNVYVLEHESKVGGREKARKPPPARRGR